LVDIVLSPDPFNASASHHRGF